MTRTSADTPSRRLGATDSQSRTRLLDAAERLMLDEGYASVTSRRVAASAGLKPQLVHYYFRTMEDLYIEVFRRRAEQNLARFAEAIAADGSLANLWRLNADPRGAAFTAEFVALANHHKAIRTEVALYAERFRSAQLAAISAALESHGISAEELPPVVGLLLATGLAQVLTLEGALGVTSGHAETMAWAAERIGELESRRPRGVRRRA